MKIYRTGTFAAVTSGLCMALAPSLGLAQTSASSSEGTISCDVPFAQSVRSADQAALDACVASLRQRGDVTGIDVVGYASAGGTRSSNVKVSEERASMVSSKLALEFPRAIVNARGAGSTGQSGRGVVVTAYVARTILPQTSGSTGTTGGGTAETPAPQEQVVILSKPDTSAVRVDVTMDDGLYEENVALGRVAYTTDAEIASPRHPSYTSTANVDDTSF